MEFTKDIYFNDNLTNGKTATITYSGALFQSGSENVNLVFGFGDNWDYTTTLPMQKTENGFSAEVEIKDYATFNFCFSNEHNNWDNNNYSNYISPIHPNVDEIVEEKINYGADYSSSIDEIIEDILGNTVQTTIANEKESDSIDKILETITEETLPEIEQLFNELFAPELEGKENVQPIVEEALEVEDTATTFQNEDTNAELIRLFNELFEASAKPEFFENTEAEESKVENVVAETPVIEESIIEGLDQPIEAENKLNVASFNLDGLVSELLDPVISQQVTTNAPEEVSLFDDIKEHEDDEEETSLTVIDSNDLLVSSRRLSSFYKFKKKIRIACYKLFVKIPKQLAKQLGFGQN